MSACRNALDSERCDDVALAVSELVTNAIRYGGEPVTMTVLPNDDGVRIEVTDGNPVLPVPAEPDDLEPGRRAWGWHAVDGGKCVWCEL